MLTKKKRRNARVKQRQRKTRYRHLYREQIKKSEKTKNYNRKRYDLTWWNAL
ncbi:26109_t:CDS:1, partial [Gigaspora rosea]